MTPEQFESLHKQPKTLPDSTSADVSISAAELKDKTPRTLIYGHSQISSESQEICTRHVYLDEVGLINNLVYSSSRQVVSQVISEMFPFQALLPNRKAYPEKTDYEFAFLAKDKGVSVSYASYSPEESSQFYGCLHIRLVENQDIIKIYNSTMFGRAKLGTDYFRVTNSFYRLVDKHLKCEKIEKIEVREAITSVNSYAAQARSEKNSPANIAINIADLIHGLNLLEQRI